MRGEAATDVLVVGAGVAALAAALAARARGASVRVVGGPRGLSHLANGAWDQGEATGAPAALAERMVRTRREAQRAVLAALGGYRAMPFRAEDRPLVATAEGGLRRVLSAERNVLDLAPWPRARVAVVGVAALPLFDARSLARALDEAAVRRGDARRFFAVEAEHARRAHDVMLSVVELARTNESAQARGRLAWALRRAVAELPADALLLPPILGVRSDEVSSHLERALGRPVGEVLSARSAQSVRLAGKLEAALDVLDPHRVRDDVTSLERHSGHVVVRSGEIDVVARAVVLCTGRALAGGLRGMHAALLPAEAADGVVVDGRARITSGGVVVSERVLGAGSLLAGLDPARAVGLGAIATSGWIAGTEAAALSAQSRSSGSR